MRHCIPGLAIAAVAMIVAGCSPRETAGKPTTFPIAYVRNSDYPKNRSSDEFPPLVQIQVPAGCKATFYSVIWYNGKLDLPNCDKQTVVGEKLGEPFSVKAGLTANVFLSLPEESMGNVPRTARPTCTAASMRLSRKARTKPI